MSDYAKQMDESFHWCGWKFSGVSPHTRIPGLVSIEFRHDDGDTHTLTASGWPLNEWAAINSLKNRQRHLEGCSGICGLNS